MGKSYKHGGERGRPKTVRPDLEEERRKCRKPLETVFEVDTVDQEVDDLDFDTPSTWIDPEAPCSGSLQSSLSRSLE